MFTVQGHIFIIHCMFAIEHLACIMLVLFVNHNTRSYYIINIFANKVFTIGSGDGFIICCCALILFC